MTLTERELDKWVRCVVEFAQEWGVAEQLRAALADSIALVRDAVAYSVSALAPDLPSPPAGADEPEADPPQTVAADPSVVDAESHAAYAHRVEHAPTLDPPTAVKGHPGATSAVRHQGEARTAQKRAVLPQEPGTAGGGGGDLVDVLHTRRDAATDSAEHERQAWLRRVQAQPIER